MMQQQARLLPVTLHSPLRHAPKLGHFDESKPTEKVQVYQLGERRIELGQGDQGVAQGLEVLSRLDCSLVGSDIFHQRNLEFAAALLSPAPPGIVDNQSPHCP